MPNVELWNILVVFLLLAFPGIVKAQDKDIFPVSMYQVDEGPRSIGANVMIVSNFTIQCNSTAIQLSVQNVTQRVAIGIIDYSDCQGEADAIAFQSYPYLNLRYNTTGVVMWYFSDLPESYNGLKLFTDVFTSTARYSANTSLIVAACKSPITVSTIGQDCLYNITAYDRAYFGDRGNCSCLQEDQILFQPNGVIASKQAHCAYNAVWAGCANLQCWSAPQKITAFQLNHTVGVHDWAGCSYVEGFPHATRIAYAINNMTIPAIYILKSSDHGKNLSCQVLSNYTLAMGEKAESSYVKIIVYYPPENAVLSNNFVSMNVNSSMNLNFSFSANPADGNILLSSKKVMSSSSPAVLSWNKSYSLDVIHVYELVITVSTLDDYGNYDVCASTYHPAGQNCSVLTISNPMTANTIHTPTELIDTSIELIHPPAELPLSKGVLIGASVSGFIILTTISFAACIIIRRRGNKNTGNTTETERSCDFGYAEYDINNAGAKYEEIGPAPHVYEVPKMNGGYEEVILPD